MPFRSARPIEESDRKYRTKYINFELEYHYGYRIITNGSIVKNGWLSESKLPKYIVDFINEHGEVLLMPSIYNGYVVGVVLRSLKKKAFLVYGHPTLYGLGRLHPNFTYGMPIVVCEGAIDCDIISRIYPNSVAMLTSALSTLQKELLKRLTNNIILLYDNDERGRQNTRMDYYNLKKMGFNVATLSQHNLVKDPGDMYDMKLFDEFNYNIVNSYYVDILKKTVREMMQ